jgi:hypothetical protein
MVEAEINNCLKLRENTTCSETKEKLKIREDLERENYIEKQLKTAKKYALEGALHAFYGGLIGCGVATSILVGIGTPLQEIVKVLPLNLAMITFLSIAFAAGFYYGYKNEIEKTKRK